MPVTFTCHSGPHIFTHDVEPDDKNAHSEPYRQPKHLP